MKITCALVAFFYLLKGELAIHNNTDSGKLFEPMESFLGAGHLFNFDKNGKTQHLLHELKYNSNQDFGLYLGTLMGNEFEELLKSTDLIIPVPLHPKKNTKEDLIKVKYLQGEYPISLKHLFL